MKIEFTMPSDKEIIDAFVSYYEEYKKYADDNYPDQVEELHNYYDNGISADVFITENSTNVARQITENGIIVNVHHVEKLPEGVAVYDSMANWYLAKFVSNPIAFARRDIDIYIDHINYQDEQAEYYEKQYEEYVEEIFNHTKEWWRKYFEESKENIEKTISEMSNEFIESSRIIRSINILYISFFFTKHDTLIEVLGQMEKDVESSFFWHYMGSTYPHFHL